MATASVWGSVRQAETSLADVMSEQMAVDLQNKENSLAGVAAVPDASVPISVESVEEADVSNDLLLAQMLQDELDRECDEMLKIEEKKFNGDSKVSVSYQMYRLRHDYPILESDEEEEYYEDDADRTRDWDSFETRERDDPHIPRCGYTVHNDQMVTKHDSRIAGRKNACKVMDLPLNVCTGDGGGFNMEVKNSVLNGLRRHARSAGQRRHRVADKADRATSQALDEPTRILVLKMINGGVLEDFGGTVSTGKEAVVIHALGGEGSEEIPDVPAECVVKVFKTTLNEFKTREKYIKADIRFKDRISRQNPRKLIHLWAEKELCNLKRLTRAGIRCPLPVTLKQHVLLMSFIGENRQPAPKLKDVQLTERQWKDAYNQVLEMTKSMYEKCGLVHADLSEYNILYHAGFCWFIDVSQSVEPFHPDALSFLYRDCVNITSFFSSKEVDVKSAEEMFSYVSGLPLNSDEDIQRQLSELEKSEQPRRRGQRRNDEEVLRDCLDAEELEITSAGRPQARGQGRRNRH